MSGRKNSLLQYHSITAEDMTQEIISSVTNIQFLDNIGVQFNFTGTPTGSFAVQVSADYNQDGATQTVINAGNWVDLNLQPAPAATGSASVIYVDINQLSSPWVRLKYTPTGAGVQTIHAVADVAGSLAGTYFLLEAGDNGSKYAVWLKVSGAGSDPAIAGYTGVEVDIATGDTGATIGAALATAIAAISTSTKFSTAGTTTVTVTNLAAGPFVPIVDGIAPLNTGFTFAVTAGAGTLDAYVTAKMV